MQTECYCYVNSEFCRDCNGHEDAPDACPECGHLHPHGVQCPDPASPCGNGSCCIQS